MIINPYVFTPVGDPYWSNVVSLLHFEGTNGSTTFTDQTGKTWTANGNAQITTSDQKFGASCGDFDGTGDYLTTPDSSDFDFGSGDFTIECYVKVPDVVGTHALFGQWGSSSRAFLLYTSGNRATFAYSLNGSTNLFAESAASIITAGTWHWVVVTREGTSVYLYVDGVFADDSAAIGTSAIFNSTNLVTIGADSGASSPLLGKVDELRVTKGVCRYPFASSPFTPPSSEFWNP